MSQERKTGHEERLHLLGIRHHGPGSARSVVAALQAVQPAVVLIEGPPDANEVLSFAASAAMVPPLALLVHDAGEPSNASFYPYAVFSPEWQALRWALANGRQVRFIDLPVAHRLAEFSEAKARAAAGDTGVDPEAPDGANGDPGVTPDEAQESAASAGASGARPSSSPQAPAVQEEAGRATLAATDAPPDAEPPDDLATSDDALRRDPLRALSRLAGYDDSESWWNALVEQDAAPMAAHPFSPPSNRRWPRCAPPPPPPIPPTPTSCAKDGGRRTCGWPSPPR